MSCIKDVIVGMRFQNHSTLEIAEEDVAHWVTFSPKDRDSEATWGWWLS